MDADLRRLFGGMHTTVSEPVKRSMAFLLTLTREDDVAAIIRATAHIQELLFNLFARNVERPKLLKPSAHSLARLIFLCRLFGEIPDDVADALKLLSEIRNPFAHNLLHEIDAKKVEAFYNSMPPRDPDIGAMLLRAAFPPGMSEEAKKLRVGAALLGAKLSDYLEVKPLPRTRLPSERVKEPSR